MFRIIVIVLLLNGICFSMASIWCFQCSWKWGEKKGEGLIDCPEEKEEIIVIGDRPNPIKDPQCVGPNYPGLYNNHTGYQVLKEACYPKACNAPGTGGRCVKWSFYLDGLLHNTTLFCTTSKELGCFTQNKGNGYTLEVCFCNENWCNSASNLKFRHYFQIFIAIFVIFFTFCH